MMGWKFTFCRWYTTLGISTTNRGGGGRWGRRGFLCYPTLQLCSGDSPSFLPSTSLHQLPGHRSSLKVQINVNVKKKNVFLAHQTAHLFLFGCVKSCSYGAVANAIFSVIVAYFNILQNPMKSAVAIVLCEQPLTQCRGGSSIS